MKKLDFYTLKRSRTLASPIYPKIASLGSLSILLISSMLAVCVSFSSVASADTLNYPWPTDTEAPCEFAPNGGTSCVNPNNSSDMYDWGVYISGVFHQYRNGYEYRNCTDYTQWKESTVNVSVPTGWGNGGQWYDSAPTNEKSTTPKAWDAAVVPGNPGHVAFVQSVNTDGTITITEYNHDAQGHGDTRTATASSMGFTEFVDFGVHPATGVNHIVGNWDGGNSTLPAVFRPSTGTWYYRTSSGTVSQQFGQSGDIPVPGYYSGSSKPDYAVYRPSNVTWYYRTQSGSVSSQSFGSTGDVPVPGDYDGDGKTNYAVFRPSNDTWYWSTSSGTVTQQFGSPGDIPAPAYWDGGSKTEPGVFRPSTGTWYYLTPSGTVSQQFGVSGDIPEPGYYSASSQPDYAVFRPSNSTWYYRTQDGSTNTQAYGSSGDTPVPGSYSGASNEDYAVWRPSNVTWYWLTHGGSSNSQAFGSTGDIPAVSTLPLPILQQYGLL